MQVQSLFFDRIPTPFLFCERVMMHFSPSPRLPHRLTHGIRLLAAHFGPLLIYVERALLSKSESESG